MSKTLLLNADYTPIKFVNYTKGFVLLQTGKAEIFDYGGAPSYWDENFLSLKTINKVYRVPATLRLLNRVPYKKKKTKFKKMYVFYRDKWKCQYCEIDLKKLNATIDHVFPTSRGGPTSWTNCVAACKHCNRKKANKTPKEANMLLKNQPQEPDFLSDVENYISTKFWHNDWNFFIHNKRI